MPAPPPVIRNIISFDGAGIYGLTQALWMKWLVEAEGSFLDWPACMMDECAQLLAGTSSGAVNALLLARYGQPRQYIDEVVSFWYAPGTWTNRCYPASVTSLMGLTAWYGTEDYKSLLYQYFGDMLMKDLSFPVMVTVYDFSDVLHEGSPDRRWRPLQLTNFPVPDDPNWLDVSEMHVAEVAYRCTTVPSLREVQGGWADGGFASADPSVLAILAASAYAEWIANPIPSPLSTPVSAWAGPTAGASAGTTSSASPPRRRISDILRALVHDSSAPKDATLAPDGFSLPLPSLNEQRLLSVGDGGPVSWYWLPNYNWGPAWNMLPVNPHQLPQGMFTPAAYTYLSPTNELFSEIAEGLLLEGNYQRLNPAITPVPIAMTVYIARMAYWRNWLLRSVEEGVCSPASLEALADARAFISSPGWTG